MYYAVTHGWQQLSCFAANNANTTQTAGRLVPFLRARACQSAVCRRPRTRLSFQSLERKHNINNQGKGGAVDIVSPNKLTSEHNSANTLLSPWYLF